MTEYEQDIFYNVEELPYEKIRELIDEAIFYSNDVVVDKIIGWQRQEQKEVDPHEWLKEKMNEKSMVRFIHRRGYYEPHELQVVVREGGDFLWIHIILEHIEYFINKYKLKKL